MRPINSAYDTAATRSEDAAESVLNTDIAAPGGRDLSARSFSRRTSSVSTFLTRRIQAILGHRSRLLLAHMRDRFGEVP